MTLRFGPTLVRRVFFSIVLAYPLLWLALLCNQFLIESGELAQNTMRWLEQDSYALEQYQSVEQARAYMLSAKRKYRSYRNKPLHYLELWSSQGERVYFDETNPYPAPPLLALHLDGGSIKGVRYQNLRRDGARWSLRLARPVLTMHYVVARDALDQSLLTALLIALPVLMMPLWLAISRGLLPLRILSRQLAGRQAGDLSALNFDARYSELRPVVAALDSLMSRLRSKVQREQNFVQDAAHELRTPMALIAAQVHVLRQAGDSAAKAAAGQQIEQGIARASHLIQQLLELARLDGMCPLAPQTLDLAQLLRQTLAQSVPFAMQREIELALEAPEVLWCTLERNTFQSMLDNLLDNAIRYARVGGMVELELTRQGDVLCLHVQDNGPGIALAEQERVFERFYRGSGHQEPGSGLGLAIARQAASRLGGSISLNGGCNLAGCCFAFQMNL